ncbi:MAG: DUF2341 domain-containing protein, partial [Desulfobacterales bacterium]|nr:DUF2341 domain-containing protein [Desulfobacterales bacterium]
MVRDLAQKHPKILYYEELEPRLLFSADVVAGLDPGAGEEHVVVEAVADDNQAAEGDVVAEAAVETAAQTAAETRWELVFVNDNVADADALIADLGQEDEGRIIETVVLDADRDGMAQVSEILAQRENLSAIHFISHGSDGRISLGNNWLTGTAIQQNSAAVSGWGDALTDTGDILFYGCNFEAGSDGHSLLDNIAELTGADVAAFNDTAGHASLDGGWELEAQRGAFETTALGIGLLPPTYAAGEPLVTQHHEIAFVDSRVTDLQTLLAGISPTAEIIILDAEHDGVTQITETLALRTDIDAIHIFSHGIDGAVELGGSWFSAFSLEWRADAFARWGESLSSGADILLYGCDVAADSEGKALVNRLAQLTGADVAASTNQTGQSVLGGDWTLEYRTGSIENNIAIDASTQQRWSGLLTVTSNGTATSAQTTNATSLTWSHTVASGTNRVLFVELAIDGLGAPASSVTYGGVALTQVGRTAGNHAVEIWRLVNPAVGTANVLVNFSASTAATGGATTYNGVDQTTPTGTYVGNTGTGTTASVVVSSATNDLVIDAENWDNSPAGYTVGAGQTQQWTQTSVAQRGVSTTEAGAASVTMSSTVSSSAQWEVGAVSIRAVADTQEPEISSVTMSESALKAGETSILTITFSEAVTNFDNNDITLANGTLTAVSSADGGVTWTGTFTPTDDIEDTTNVISVGTSLTDLAGNAPLAGASTANYAIDTNTPTIQSMETADLDGDGTIDAVHVTFSEAVDDSTIVANDWDVDGVTGEAFSSTTNGDTANDADIYITFEDGVLDTGATPDVTYSQDDPTDADVTDLAGNKLGNFGQWWDSQWLSRSQITFDNANSAEDLADFPVAVSFTAADIDFDKIKAGGADIRFVDGDGTTLDYEIESWDDTPGSETATVWVRVPQIDAGSTTDSIHIYYNNTAATDAQDATGVWDASHEGVWHMDQSTTGAVDIGGGETGTPSGTPTGSTTHAVFDENNVANSDGTITEVKINVDDLGNGDLRIMTASRSGNTFTVRDFQNLTVTGTGVQTFAVDLDVKAGDYLGFWSDSASVERETTGSSQYLYQDTSTTPSVGQQYAATQGGNSLRLMMSGTGSGISIVDSTVNSNDGNVLGATEATGQIGEADDFNGDADYVDLGTSVDLSGAVTMSAWINLDDNTITDWVRPIVVKGESGSGIISGNASLEIINGGQTGVAHLTFTLDTDAGRYRAIDTISAPTGSWVHVVGTFDGSTVRLYRDGIEQDSAGTSGSFSNNTYSTYIGAYPGDEANTAIDGTIDEVRISTTSRSADWIEAAYLSQNGTFAFASIGAEEQEVATTDKAAPVVTSSIMSDSALKVGETSTLTITFSEAVTNFDNSDITLANGTLTAVASGDGGTTWTGTFTPTDDIEDTSNVISVGTTLTDLAGNAPLAGADTANYEIDTKDPTVAITLDDSALNVGDTSTVTFTFSEAPTGFALGDISADNGVVSGLAVTGDPKVYTATFTPTDDIEDTSNVISVGTGYTDAAGNTGTGNTSANYEIDTREPVVASAVMSDSALKAGETATLTITFSEAVTNFDNTDITLANGTLTAVASGDGGTTWTGTFTPTDDIEDTSNVISVGTTLTDLAGNAPLAGADTANYEIDTKDPTVAITLDDSALNVGDTSTVTFTFSEAPTGFALGDISADNGVVSGLAVTGDPKVYTATFTPTDDIEDTSNVISVGTGYTDAAGNTGTGNTSANYEIDTREPVVASAVMSDSALKAGETATLTITFSEAVTNFDNTNITLANGTLTAVASGDGGVTWTGTFTPTDDIEDTSNVISVGTALTDLAGNAPLAGASTANYTIDTKEPVVTAAQRFNLSEGAANTTSVGTVAATDGGTIQDWSITSGNEDGIFQIDASTGEITVADNTNLDRETTASYSLGITVSDGANTSVVETVAITITDVNEDAPVVDAGQSFNLVEGTAEGTSVGVVTATDADAGTVYQDWTITSGNGDGIFQIDSNTGEITVVDNTNLDRETTAGYTLSVTVSDGVNTSVVEIVTVTITDVNDTAPVVDAAQSFDLVDDVVNGNSVGTAMVTDADTGTVYQDWTIVSGNGDGIFAIDGNTGEITVADNTNIDYLVTNRYQLILTVSDGVNTSAGETVTVDIVKETGFQDGVSGYTGTEDTRVVEEVPTQQSGNDAQLDVDIDVGGFVHQGLISFENIFGGGAGQIPSGSIITSASLTLVVNDAALAGDQITLHRMLVDWDEAATWNSLTGGIQANDVEAASAADATLGSPDSAGSNTFYGLEATVQAWVDGDPNYGWAILTDSANGWVAATSEDGTPAFRPSLNIQFRPPPRPPVALDQALAVAEDAANSNVVGTVAASDPDDGDSLTYTITAGNDDGIFHIDAASGDITVVDNSTLDREATSSYTLTVKVEDTFAMTDTAAVTVNITDVNDNTPVVDAAQTFTLAEDAANGDSVGTATATDADETTTYQEWTITSGNGDGTFAIDANTGQLTVLSNANLDRETTASYTLGLTVSDGTNTSTGQTVTVTVTDVNDNDPVAVDESITVAEGGTVTTLVGGAASVLTNDTDADLPYDTLSVAVGAGPTNGSLTLNADGTFSYTHNGSENLTDSFTYTVSDADGGVTDSGTVSITVTPVNDNDPAAVDETITVAEGGT